MLPNAPQSVQERREKSGNKGKGAGQVGDAFPLSACPELNQAEPGFWLVGTVPVANTAPGNEETSPPAVALTLEVK